MVAVPARPVEWWERLASSIRRRLVARPRAALALRVTLLASAALTLVAALFQRGFRAGIHVWFPCFLMVLAWTALAPTRTLRWPSLLRLFALATVWAGLVARLASGWSDIGFLSRNADGPGVAIAAFVEETFKLLPLALLAALAPGRVRRFAVTDWLLVGLVSGMGFQAAEDAVRQIVYRPGFLDLLNGNGRPWAYGWTLFGGQFDLDGKAGFPGHHITTALVATGIGLAVHATLRRRRRWALWWLLPAALWFVVVTDHLAYNAAARDRRYITAPASKVPQIFHDVWAALGHGYGRGWLLVVALVVALAVDAGQLAVHRGEPAPDSSGAPRVARLGALAAHRIRALVLELGERIEGIVTAAVAPAARPADRGVAALRDALARRAAREDAMAVDPGPGRQLTRAVALATGTLAAFLSVRIAVSLARHIGASVGARGNQAWFAGLLDALARWWDGLGPGGQGLVLVGAAAVLVGVGLILAPEVVIPVVIGIAADGTAITGAVVIPATVTTGAGVVATGTGVVAMTAGAASGGGGSDGGESGGSTSSGSGGGEPPRYDPARLDALAKDPAHGGRITPGSLEEAKTGLDLEASGQVRGPLTRDPTGGAEFVDAEKGAWDVKSWNSNYPNGYRLDDAMKTIADSIRDGEGVMVNTANMNEAAVTELRAAVEARADWVGKVLWRTPPP